MPIWAILGASGYGLLIAYQATLAIELGRSGFRVLPFLLVKLVILFFALSYWDAGVCKMLGGHVGPALVLFAGLLTLREVAWNVRFTLIDPPPKLESDDLAVLVAVFAGVVFPVAVFIVAAVVAVSGWCIT